MVSRISSLSLSSSDKSLIGVGRLLDDLHRLMQDGESADILFIVGREEVQLPAHKLLLRARCKSFIESTNGDVCNIPGSTVTLSGHQTAIRLPQYQSSMFQLVLLYIYTGKVCLNENNVLEVFGVGQDLGLDELCQNCEDHLSSMMTPQTACSFLLAALAMDKRMGGTKSSKSFVDRIVAFIGENALESFHSTSFLALSREAVIRLISSDNLALEEEDVWRGVLNWAKLKAGVSVPTTHWTEDERLRVCQHLQGVINHVRLLLIDSQVFAEEVEPTGAVPMELSLERYRFAALPNKFKDNSTNEDKRLQPRVSLKLFSGSQILANEKMSLQRILNNWYGVGKQMWRLLFRASSHGYSADAFHRHCDGMAPTYTVVMGQHGEVCGGYSDVPWSKTSLKGRYVASDKAFLFTLINNQDLPPMQFPVMKKMFAVCYHPDCGPIFGAGADLFISSNCNQNLESYSNLPHSYDGDDSINCATLMGDYNFTVLDYEVFTPFGK